MKACPFCGSLALREVTEGMPGSALDHIVCRRCGARGPGAWNTTAEECWNRRTILPEATLKEAWDAVASDPHREEAHGVLMRIMEIVDPPEDRQAD